MSLDNELALTVKEFSLLWVMKAENGKLLLGSYLACTAECVYTCNCVMYVCMSFKEGSALILVFFFFSWYFCGCGFILAKYSSVPAEYFCTSLSSLRWDFSLAAYEVPVASWRLWPVVVLHKGHMSLLHSSCFLFYQGLWLLICRYVLLWLVKANRRKWLSVLEDRIWES